MSFLNNLINGISLGSVYAIIALGYTMVYGIAKMLNFAHGDVIMVGGIHLSFLRRLQLYWACPPGLLGVLLAMVVCTVLGMVIERLAYKPLRAGALPGRAHHRHRRELLPPERRSAALDLQPQDLLLRQWAPARLLSLFGGQLHHHLCGPGDRGGLHRHHAGAHLVHRQDQDGQGHAGLLRGQGARPSSWASTSTPPSP